MIVNIAFKDLVRKINQWNTGEGLGMGFDPTSGIQGGIAWEVGNSLIIALEHEEKTSLDLQPLDAKQADERALWVWQKLTELIENETTLPSISNDDQQIYFMPFSPLYFPDNYQAIGQWVKSYWQKKVPTTIQVNNQESLYLADVRTVDTYGNNSAGLEIVAQFRNPQGLLGEPFPVLSLRLEPWIQEQAQMTGNCHQILLTDFVTMLQTLEKQYERPKTAVSNQEDVGMINPHWFQLMLKTEKDLVGFRSELEQFAEYYVSTFQEPGLEKCEVRPGNDPRQLMSDRNVTQLTWEVILTFRDTISLATEEGIVPLYIRYVGGSDGYNWLLFIGPGTKRAFRFAENFVKHCKAIWAALPYNLEQGSSTELNTAVSSPRAYDKLPISEGLEAGLSDGFYKGMPPKKGSLIWEFIYPGDVDDFSVFMERLEHTELSEGWRLPNGVTLHYEDTFPLDTKLKIKRWHIKHDHMAPQFISLFPSPEKTQDPNLKSLLPIPDANAQATLIAFQEHGETRVCFFDGYNAISEPQETPQLGQVLVEFAKFIEGKAQERRKANTAVSGQMQPVWEQISDVGYNRLLVELWCKRRPTKEIAARIDRSEKTVFNELCALRKVYGEKIVPKRRK